MSTQSNQSIPAAVPEKLNLWDRFFNRYRRVVHDRGAETWVTTPQPNGYPIPSLAIRSTRHWIEYRITDRLTGSVRIEREYLN